MSILIDGSVTMDMTLELEALHEYGYITLEELLDVEEMERE